MRTAPAARGKVPRVLGRIPQKAPNSPQKGAAGNPEAARGRGRLLGTPPFLPSGQSGRGFQPPSGPGANGRRPCIQRVREWALPAFFRPRGWAGPKRERRDPMAGAEAPDHTTVTEKRGGGGGEEETPQAPSTPRGRGRGGVSRVAAPPPRPHALPAHWAPRNLASADWPAASRERKVPALFLRRPQAPPLPVWPCEEAAAAAARSGRGEPGTGRDGAGMGLGEPVPVTGD